MWKLLFFFMKTYIDVFLSVLLPFELSTSNSELLPAKFSVLDRDYTAALAMRTMPSPQGTLQRQQGLS